MVVLLVASSSQGVSGVGAPLTGARTTKQARKTRPYEARRNIILCQMIDGQRRERGFREESYGELWSAWLVRKFSEGSGRE